MGKPAKLKTNDDLDELALDAIASGVKSNGAIASHTKMGATAAYQAVERLKQSNRITQSTTGELSIT